MHDRPTKTYLSSRRCDLDGAARVARNHQIRLQSLDVSDFAHAQVAGRFRLNEVVDAGAAATHPGFDRADELEAWNRSQEVAWLGPIPLGMRQMTCVVVGDLGLQRLTRGTRLTELGQCL